MEEILKYFTDQGISEGLAITYIIVSALLVIMAVVALVMRLIVFIKYQRGNHMTTAMGKTSLEVARETLDKAGLSHIKVAKASWLRAFIFGNSYSLSKKTIFLRRGIVNKNTITAVGMALQKVGVARLCEGESKIAKTRNIMQILNLFAPLMFVPVMLLGFVIDLLLFSTPGVFSIVGIAVGLFLVLTGFIATLLNIPVEKRANEMAMQTIEETGVLNEEEKKVIKQVFDAYIIAYVCEFIVAVLRIVQMILEIVMKMQATKNN